MLLFIHLYENIVGSWHGSGKEDGFVGDNW